MLDATHYRWRNLYDSDKGVFAQFVGDDTPKPRSLGPVEFDTLSFDRTDYHTNGVSWSYYGSGRIWQYAAIQLDNGKVLFCVVEGESFGGTDHSNDKIQMQYYELEALPGHG